MAEALEPGTTPAASGVLATRPIAHLLVYARNRRLSGRMELDAGDGRDATISFWRGRISGVRTAPPIAYFGTVAYELGYIDTPTLDASLLEISRSKQLHGQVLIARGALTEAQRDEILGEQACRKLHALFSFPASASFEFYDAPPAPTEPPLTLDAIKPVWRGLRDSVASLPPAIGEVLARYAGLSLRLTNEGPITNAGLTTQEAAVCEDLLARSTTLAQLRIASTLPTNHVDLLVYLLLITKCAELAAASSASDRAFAAAPAVPESQRSFPAPESQRSIPAPPESQRSIPAPPESQRSFPPPPESQRSIPAPPVSSRSRISAAPGSGSGSGSGSGEVRVSLSFRVPSTPAIQSAPPASTRSSLAMDPVFGPADLGPAGIAHRAQTIDNEGFFEVLGLADGATVDAARAAYFRLAKLWHPERLPSDLEPFRSEVEKVFMQMTRASATLTDPDAHRAYMTTRSRDAGKNVIASRPRVDVIRDIEAGIAKRDFLIAEQNARHLVELDGDDADAMALGAWAAVQAGEAPEEVLRAALPQLDKAVHRDTYCERAHFYRGFVHKRLGSSAAAFRDFTRVIQINPKHVDAQREIRIFEMRARKGSGEHAVDALIGKNKKK